MYVYSVRIKYTYTLYIRTLYVYKLYVPKFFRSIYKDIMKGEQKIKPIFT